MPKPPAPRLDVVERGELRDHEKVIDEGKATFLAVGNALKAIQDGKLYREEFKSFPAYLDSRHDFQKAWAYRLIQHAEVVENLSSTLESLSTPQLPSRQVEALAKLPDDQQANAYQDAADGQDGPPTTEAVISSAKLYAADNEPYEEPEDDPEPDPPDEPDGSEHATEALSMLRKADNQAKAYAMSFIGSLYFGKGKTLLGFQERLRAAKRSLAACVPVDCPDCPGEGCTVCNGSGLLLKAHLQGDPITPNQAKLLAKRGVEVDGMSKKEASQAIDDIAAAEGWEQRPKEGQADG